MAIDPLSASNTSASNADAAFKTLSGDYQNFLKLLTVQLQNQDPTNPTDTNQLTQNIAMLSTVEQQINTNKNLEKLIDIYNATQYNSVVSYIGKQIEAPGAGGSLTSGQALFVYYLQDEANVVDYTITDEAGNVVYNGKGTTTRGRNEINWDGKGNSGEIMPNGVYTLEVAAKNASGDTVTSQIYTTGIVNAVDSVAGQVYMSIGELSIPIGQITSIREHS